ncbi:unnamed protein product [Colias eurytheme]|nr:unnamed protein product [Colias eurytheme]
MEHEESSNHVKQCIGLAFLPKQDIEDGWLHIMENSFDDEAMTKFNDYFVTQWLEYPDLIWCCHNERHRTTNLAESWNGRFNKVIGKNPSLLLFLQTIGNDTCHFDIKQAKNENSKPNAEWPVMPCKVKRLGPTYEDADEELSLMLRHDDTDIVCCDGHIVECLGPYKATTNDATITSLNLNNEETGFGQFFRRGVIFILDRGFRDVVSELQEHGFVAYMPESLLDNEHQLSTQQANRSRLVTMCSWVVEVVNARAKRDYRLFRNVFNNRAAMHLKDDFRIACALLNKVHVTINDPPEAFQYVTIAKNRLSLENHLATFVESETVNRRRANIQQVDSEHPHLTTFPRLTITDLKRLALGTYQLKQARSYFGEHVRQSGIYLVQVITARYTAQCATALLQELDRHGVRDISRRENILKDAIERHMEIRLRTEQTWSCEAIERTNRFNNGIEGRAERRNRFWFWKVDRAQLTGSLNGQSPWEDEWSFRPSHFLAPIAAVIVAAAGYLAYKAVNYFTSPASSSQTVSIITRNIATQQLQPMLRDTVHSVLQHTIKTPSLDSTNILGNSSAIQKDLAEMSTSIVSMTRAVERLTEQQSRTWRMVMVQWLESLLSPK